MTRALAVAVLALALAGAASTAPGRSNRPHRPPWTAGTTDQPRFIPQSVSFASPSVGWAWGPAHWIPSPGVLARTDDGGRTWTEIQSPPLSYPGGVRFIDRDHGYLFGRALWATLDGGRRWHRIPLPAALRDVETGAGQAYALTSRGVYRITGRPVPIGPAVRGSGNLVVHGAAIYFLGSGSLWASADQGRSWRRLAFPCAAPAGIAALAAWSTTGLALACGGEPGAGNEAKTFYASTDGGARWRVCGRTGFTPGRGLTGGYVSGLAAAGPRTWVLTEARGGIAVTHDGGRTWRFATIAGTTAEVEGWGNVALTSATHAVAVPWTLNGDVLAFTADAGRTWHEVRFRSR
jgi:photosystem II stability/assembly factor-like uncharacterized protein